MNLYEQIAPYSFLDASQPEEESVLDRLHMIFSFPSTSSSGILHGFQLSGPGEVAFNRVKPLLTVRLDRSYALSSRVLTCKTHQQEAETHARALSSAVHTMLAGEEAKSNARAYR